MKRLITVIFFLLSTAAISQKLSFEEYNSPAARTSPATSQALELKFKAYKLVTLNGNFRSISRNSHSILLSIPGLGEVAIKGRHNKSVGDQTKLTIKSASNFQTTVNAPMVHFSGKTEESNDYSNISIGEKFLLGSFIQKGERYFIEQLKNFIPGSADNMMVVYKASDVIGGNVTCGTASGQLSNLKDQKIKNNEGDRVAITGPRTVELALAADYTTYLNHGQNVNSVAMYISGVVNLAQGLYSGVFANDLTFQITEIVVFTTPQLNPWPSTSNLGTNVVNFANWGQTGFSKPFDLSQYWFHNPTFVSGPVGAAHHLGDLCSNQGNIAITEYNATIYHMQILVAHEIGHCFNTDHDAGGSPYIMAPSVNLNPYWSSASISAINNYLASPATDCITAPGVVVSYNTSGQVCPGAAIIFSATVTGTAGNSPHYQWKVNGINAGTDSFQFSTTTLSGGDVVSCAYTSEVVGVPTTLLSNNVQSPVISAPIFQLGDPPESFTTLCEGNSLTLKVNVTNNVQWFKNGAVINGATGATLLVTTTGIYTAKVVIGGCESASSGARNITFNPTGAPVLTADSQVICGSGSVNLNTSTPNGGVFIYRNGVLVNTFAASTPYSINLAGTYTLKTTCSTVFSNPIVITASPLPATPTITASGPVTFCAGGNVTLTTNESTGIQWYKNGVLIAGATNQSFIASTAGSYTVGFTVGTCTSFSSGTTVTVTAIPSTPSIYANNFITSFCQGQNTTLLQGAGPVATYQWYKDGVSLNGATGSSLIVSVGGSYTLKSTINGCTSDHSNAVDIIVNPIPPAPVNSAGGPTTFCNDASVTLTSNAATGNKWYNLNFPGIVYSINTSYTVTTSGIYAVTSEINGCTSALSNSIVVVVNPIPTTPNVSTGGSTTFCQGGTVTLTSSVPTGNQWFKDGTSVNGATGSSFVASLSGVYSAKIIQNGCTSASSNPITVTVNPVPPTPTLTAAGPTEFCVGGSVTLNSNASVAHLTIWYRDGILLNGISQASITVGTTGVYYVQSSGQGCTSAISNSIVVTSHAEPVTPTISAGSTTTFCQGGSVTLTSTASQGNQWYLAGNPINGATGVSLVVNASGSYSVKSTINGCTSPPSNSITATVNSVPPAPVVSANGPTTFCAGGSVVLSTGGNQWYKDGNLIAGATASQYTATTSGSYTSRAISTCTSTPSNAIVVTVVSLPTTPTVSAGAATTFCQGESVTLSSNAPSGNQWYLNGTTLAGSTATTLVAIASGSYQVRSTVSGCTSNSSNAVAVTANPIPATPTISSAGSTTFCQGETVTLNSNAASGNQWFKNGTLINGATAVSLQVTTSGSYSVKTTATGCTSLSSNTIAVVVNAAPAAPVVTAGGAITFCAGGNVTLTSNASSGNQWYKDGTAVASATGTTLSVSTTGNYSVKSTVNSCTSSLSNVLSVTVNAIPVTPVVSAGGATSFCQGGTLTLSSNAAVGNQWYLNASTLSGSTATTLVVSASGSYSLRSTVNGCTSATSNAIVVTVSSAPAKPTLSLSGPTTFCYGASLTILSNSTEGIQWFKNGTNLPGSVNSSLAVSESGVYSTTSTVGGCSSPLSDLISVTVTQSFATPTISASGPTTFCEGNSLEITSDAASGNQWQMNGAAISGSNGPSITVSSAGTYSVIKISGECVSDRSNEIAIVINPVPPTPVISLENKELVSSALTGNQWFIDGAILPGKTSQTITPSVSGHYTVQVTEQGCSSLMSIPFDLVITSILDIASDATILLYPNPVKDFLFVDNKLNEVHLHVLDMTGKELITKTIQEGITTLNVGDLSAGPFLLIIKDVGSDRVRRQIVVKVR